MVVSNLLDGLKRSNQLADKRRRKAEALLGQDVVARIIIFALHLWGGEAKSIAEALGWPVDTVNGVIKRVYKEGLPALEDRRQRTSAFLPVAAPKASAELMNLSAEEDNICAEMGGRQLLLPRSDDLLCRTMVLCFLEAGWVALDVAAEALGLSEERARKLKAQIKQHGASSLLDHRTGQSQEYRMVPDTKAELIWQYVINVEEGQSVSAARLKQDLENRGEKCPSVQTVAVHVKKLGLNALREKKRRRGKVRAKA